MQSEANKCIIFNIKCGKVEKKVLETCKLIENKIPRQKQTSFQAQMSRILLRSSEMKINNLMNCDHVCVHLMACFSWV